MTKQFLITSFTVLLLVFNSTNAIATPCNPAPVYPEYTMDAFFSAWQVLNNETPGGSSHRLSLEYLNSKHWKQAGINMGFSKVVMQNRNFASAQIPQIQFHNANLDGSRFIEAKICHSNFQITSLAGVNFARAILTGSIMHRANAKGAQWGGAILTDVDVSDVDFDGARGLTQTQLDSACYRPGIGAPKNLPAGLNNPGHC